MQGRQRGKSNTVLSVGELVVQAGGPGSIVLLGKRRDGLPMSRQPASINGRRYQGMKSWLGTGDSS